jgi:hypothetical protein
MARCRISLYLQLLPHLRDKPPNVIHADDRRL